MHEIQFHITHKESNKPFAPQTPKKIRSKSATLPETTVSNKALENMAFAQKRSRIVLEPSIFRCELIELFVSGRIIFQQLPYNFHIKLSESPQGRRPMTFTSTDQSTTCHCSGSQLSQAQSLQICRCFMGKMVGFLVPCKGSPYFFGGGVTLKGGWHCGGVIGGYP